MATVQSAIAARLAADVTLTAAQPGGLGFTVYDKWLVKTGPGSTPAAFDDTKGGRLKRSIVVLEESENDHPGRQGDGGKRLATFPTTHIFVEAHANGKQAAQDAYRRIEALFLGWDIVLSAGERLGFVAGSRLRPDDTLFPGNIVVVARWQFVGTRKLVAA